MKHYMLHMLHVGLSMWDYPMTTSQYMSQCKFRLLFCQMPFEATKLQIRYRPYLIINLSHTNLMVDTYITVKFMFFNLVTLLTKSCELVCKSNACNLHIVMVLNYVNYASQLFFL